MSQRLSLVVQVCTLAACAALVFVAWQMQEGQRTQQEAFLAALAKLTEPRETKPATPPETRLAVQLKASSPDEPLPELAKLHIEGTHLSNSEIKSDKLFDRETGRIDFGRIPPGAYFLRAETPFGYATRRIDIAMGENYVEEFALPQTGKEVPLALAIERPALISQEDWDKAGLGVFASFEPLPVSSDGDTWRNGSSRFVLQGASAEVAASIYRFPWQSITRESLGNRDSRREILQLISKSATSLGAGLPTGGPSNLPSVTVPEGLQYRLVKLGLMTLPNEFEESRRTSERNDSQPVIVLWDASHPDFPAWARAEGNIFVADTVESPPYNQLMLPWRIDIPDAMANEVLAQIQQNTELAAARVVQEREAAEQTALMLAAKERASRGPTQNRVRLRFVEETAEGPAVRPNQVALVLPGSAKPLTPVVDETGWADFGYLDAGLYSLQVHLSSGAGMTHTFVVHPQRDYEETILCPPEPTPIVTRKMLVPLPKSLQSHGIWAYVQWDWQVSEAEKWNRWGLSYLPPLKKTSPDNTDLSQRHWTGLSELKESEETAVSGEYRIRAVQIRPRMIQLNWPDAANPDVYLMLGQSQWTDQPWIDLDASTDEPIVINIPPDLVAKAEAVLKSLRPVRRESNSPTQNRVRLRFVEGTADGSAVRPYRLALTIPGNAMPVTPALDEVGWADLGYLDAGLYSLKVQLLTGAEMLHSFVVHPRKNHEEVIICPPEPEPIVQRTFLVSLSEALKDKEVRVSIEWEWKSPDAEKWKGWELGMVMPFAKPDGEGADANQRQWSAKTLLDQSKETTFSGEYLARPILVRPLRVTLTCPRPDVPEISDILLVKQFTDQPWIDLAKAENDPITITLPPDTLAKAEAEFKKFLRRYGDETATPTPQ